MTTSSAAAPAQVSPQPGDPDYVNYSSTEVSPTEARKLIEAVFKTKRTAAVWGPMGTAKSSVVKDIANDWNMAVVDMRLTQYIPEDLRGVPYPHAQNGFTGTSSIPPEEMPRDLDFNFKVEIDAEDETVVEFYNPRSKTNQLFYCQDPVITVKPIDDRSLKVSVGPVVDDKGARLHDRFSLKVTDVNGKPVACTVRVFVKGAVKVIWCLEEFNSAELMTQAACYELLLDRRLSSYEVPDGAHIIALGNLDSDKGYTMPLLGPVSNRLVHFTMSMKYIDWKNWAIGRIHPFVLTYLESNQTHLHFEKPPVVGQKAFETARTWEFLSDLIYANPDAPQWMIHKFTQATVGESFGTTFIEHIRAATSNRVTPEDVLSGRQIEVKFTKREQVYLSYYMQVHMCAMLQAEWKEIKGNPSFERHGYLDQEHVKTYFQRCANYLLFLGQLKNEDQQVAGAMMAVRSYNVPFSYKKRVVPGWEAFSTRIGKYLLDGADTFTDKK